MPFKPFERVNYQLKVTMPNGEIIHHAYGSDTFVETIERIGIERVKSLNLMYGKFPLIDDVVHPTGKQRKSGRYYIRMPIAPYRQAIVLRRIAEGLNINLTAPLVT